MPEPTKPQVILFGLDWSWTGVRLWAEHKHLSIALQVLFTEFLFGLRYNFGGIDQQVIEDSKLVWKETHSYDEVSLHFAVLRLTVRTSRKANP